MERKTIRGIKTALSKGAIPDEFRAADVDTALGITYASTFLPKHRLGNPGNNTELFIQISKGLYKLKA
ncbi:MAG: hypothetical protein P3T54_03380 [Dehalogenimonas sp.]|uniref:HTH HARE-type domain-containing protein n=1 Tax=Candidatus Dehalogenimonas loeffleri TaxID=3127115 RepID=A0ABZ2J701_9CHLR|nr:hypothetical protein [Dehalogenimonas sp.]